MKRQLKSERTKLWDELIAVLSMHGYVDPPVIENPLTVFCVGENGDVVVRKSSTKPHGVILVHKGGETWIGPTCAEDVVAAVLAAVGPPKQGGASA